MFVSRERLNEALRRIETLEQERRNLLDRIVALLGASPLYAIPSVSREEQAPPVASEPSYDPPQRLRRIDIRTRAALDARKRAGLAVPISPEVQADLEAAEREGRKRANG